MNSSIQKLVDAYYLNYYEKVHSNLKSKSRLSFHFQLESARTTLEKYPIVLEIGAGTSSHPKFLKHDFEVYLLTDIRTIKDNEISSIESGLIPQQPGIYKSIADATQLPYSDDSVDRVVSGCLLLHLDDQISALEEWLRVLKPGGVIDTLIPNDQSFSIWLYRLLFSRRKARKLGFNDFDLVNAFEHHSYYERIFRLASATFPTQQYEFQHYPPIIGGVQFFRAFSILRLKKF
jgi:SAM-dependent methyltransferase